MAVPLSLHLEELYLLLVVESVLGREVQLAGGWDVVWNGLGHYWDFRKELDVGLEFGVLILVGLFDFFLL